MLQKFVRGFFFKKNKNLTKICHKNKGEVLAADAFNDIPFPSFLVISVHVFLRAIHYVVLHLVNGWEDPGYKILEVPIKRLYSSVDTVSNIYNSSSSSM